MLNMDAKQKGFLGSYFWRKEVLFSFCCGPGGYVTTWLLALHSGNNCKSHWWEQKEEVTR